MVDRLLYNMKVNEDPKTCSRARLGLENFRLNLSLRGGVEMNTILVFCLFESDTP